MKTLVRLPNWIGDAVMATPFLKLLVSRSEPNGVSVWGPPRTAELFKHFPGLDRVYDLDEKREPEKLQELREANFDRIYLLTNSYSTAAVAKQLGIPERIGYRRQWRGFLLTRPVFCGPKIRNLHMMDYYLHLLPSEWLEEPVDRQPLLVCTPEEKEECRQVLSKMQDRDSEKKIVGMAPGAAFGPAKQWFPENFRKLAEALVGEGYRILVFGTESDRELGFHILQEVPEARGMNLAGSTSLRQLMGFISLCDCLVANDSGPMHIADAVGTPVVAFFGSTDSGWTGPRAAHHRVFQADVVCNPCFLRECPLDLECMRSFSVADAFTAVQEALNAPVRSGARESAGSSQ